MKKIYILDDEKAILDPLAVYFNSNGYSVNTFLSSEDLLSSLIVEKPDIIILDVNLVGDDGRQLCSLIKVKYRNRLPIILFSASPSLGEKYKDFDADAFIAKPFKIRDLSTLVASYLS